MDYCSLARECNGNETKAVSASTRRAHAGRFHVFKSNKNPSDRCASARSVDARRGGACGDVRSVPASSFNERASIGVCVRKRLFMNRHMFDQDLPTRGFVCGRGLSNFASHRRARDTRRRPPSTSIPFREVSLHRFPTVHSSSRTCRRDRASRRSRGRSRWMRCAHQEADASTRRARPPRRGPRGRSMVSARARRMRRRRTRRIR